MRNIAVILVTATFTVAQVAVAQSSAPPPLPDIAARSNFLMDDYRQINSSSWYTGENETFSALFANSHFDWLMAPAQIQWEGFDSAERLMMDAELARAFNARGIAVPDPYLIERALGYNSRVNNYDGLDALAHSLGATTVVIPYVGHDDSGNLKITLAMYQKPSKDSPLASIRPVYVAAKNVHFDDAMAPIDAFRAALPALIDSMAIGVPAPTVDEHQSAVTLLTLPDSPDQLSTPSDHSALADAARLAVLAYLAPPDSQAVNRLFGRSLLASLQAPDSPAQEFLHGYALLRLRLRPAAIGVLKDKEPAIEALISIANGNLPGLDEKIKRTSGYERLILEGEENDLWRLYRQNSEYQPLGPYTASLASRSELWRMLLERRWAYGRPGSERSNVPLKEVLDTLYPVPGQSLRSIVEGQQAALSAPVGGLNLEMSVHEHIAHLLRDQGSQWCCRADTARPNSWDFLTLIEAWSDENLLQAVQTEQFFRGLSEQAKAMMTPLDAYFEGRPDFELLHAQIDVSLANAAIGPEQTSLRRSANEHAFLALVASGGQSDDAIEALTVLGPDPRALSVAAGYANDYPLHDAWIDNSVGVDQKEQVLRLRRALANTETGVGIADMLLITGGDSEKAEVKASLNERFLGSPGRDQIEAKLLDKQETPDSAIASLRRKVQEQPDIWDLRDQLGHTLALQRDYAGAAKVMGQYPGFALQNPDNAVYLSNIAADTGFMFYWDGAIPEAEQFLKLSTHYDVGSESEMGAAVVLAVLENNLPQGLDAAERWVQRYPDDDAYYYYLSLLHALGHSQQAWNAFNTLLGRNMGAGEWSAAAVGLRIAGTTPAQLHAWISRPEVVQAQTPAISWPARFLLMWATTDRSADAELPSEISSLGKEPRGVSEDGGRTAFYPQDAAGDRYMVIRSSFGEERRLPLPPNAPQDSDSLLFADALIPFQQGDLRAAVTKFDELASRYPIEHAVQGADAMYALPYFAYASAKAGDPLKLRAFLTGLKEKRFYEICLAGAYFDALMDHDSSAALKELDQALLWVPRDDDARAPSGDYQYVDTAERLYKDTGDVRFRDRALEWSRSLQRMLPWLSWPYAVVAELSNEVGERRSALVKALYLDPLSPRLKSVPAADIEYAETQLSAGNPFARQRGDIQTQTTQNMPQMTGEPVAYRIANPRYVGAGG